MRAPYTQLYVHLVWSLWDRLSIITEHIQPRLNAEFTYAQNPPLC